MPFITPAFAQTEPHPPPPVVEPHAAPAPGVAPAPAGELHEGTEVHGGEAEHGLFPPFDPATFGSQLFWLAVTFGLLYLLMSRVALPRIGAILEERSNQIAGDLGQAGRLKSETDAAIAAYEQALAEARQNAQAIALTARGEAKTEIDTRRTRIEADLQGRLDAAETRIGEVKARALMEVDAIAREATQAIVETLVGGRTSDVEVARAVEAARAERI